MITILISTLVSVGFAGSGDGTKSVTWSSWTGVNSNGHSSSTTQYLKSDLPQGPSDAEIKATKEYQTCFQFQRNSAVPEKHAETQCLDSKRRSRFTDSDINSCFQYMTDIAATTRLKDPSAPLNRIVVSAEHKGWC